MFPIHTPGFVSQENTSSGETPSLAHMVAPRAPESLKRGNPRKAAPAGSAPLHVQEMVRKAREALAAGTLWENPSELLAHRDGSFRHLVDQVFLQLCLRNGSCTLSELCAEMENTHGRRPKREPGNQFAKHIELGLVYISQQGTGWRCNTGFNTGHRISLTEKGWALAFKMRPDLFPVLPTE